MPGSPDVSVAGACAVCCSAVSAGRETTLRAQKDIGHDSRLLICARDVFGGRVGAGHQSGTCEPVGPQWVRGRTLPVGQRSHFPLHKAAGRARGSGRRSWNRAVRRTALGRHVLGQAYVFSSRCGPQAYFVGGAVSEDQRTVTLIGDVPIRYDSRCAATATRPDTLVFTFIEPPAPPPGIAVAPPAGPTLPVPAPPAVIVTPVPAPPPSHSLTGAVGDTVGSDRTAEKVMN